jgi:hypothetical protein
MYIKRRCDLGMPAASTIVALLGAQSIFAQSFFGSFPDGPGYESQYSFDGSLQQTVRNLGAPRGAALDSKGNLYVANSLSLFGEPPNTTSTILFSVPEH